MKNNLKGKIFNLKLFKKLMVFVKPYSFYYRLWALSYFRPKLLFINLN